VNLLGAKLYDPAVAVSKATSSLLALTAFDTTNLRLAITVPAHGFVRFRIRCVVTGATTVPVVMLGVLNGASVVARVIPHYAPCTANAATQDFNLDAEFTVPGLTPGAANFDAAYGVEVVVASTNIKYGGPNNTTTNDAWGAFVFEAWDPQPIATAGQLSVDANGRVDVIKVAGTTQTARDLGLQLDAAVSTRMATYTQPTGFLAATFPLTVASTTNITAGTITTVTNLTNAPTAGDLTAVMKASVTTAATAATPVAASVTGNVGGNVVGSVGSVTGLTAANLDVAVSTRLATAGYTAPLDAAGTRSAVGLASANMDTQLATLATAAALSTVGANVTGIKAKTDSLNFAVAGYADVNIRYVNSVAINGDGSATPWGP